MGAPVNHRRLKPKYNPTPNSRERKHHAFVMEQGCLVCGGDAVAHHVLQDTPNKRWRRDHQILVPLCDGHHRELHANGNEIKWQQGHGLNLSKEAEFYRLQSIYAGIL